MLSQLEKLRSGGSIYKFVPNDIGEILYCDTTEPKEFPLTPRKAKIKRLIGLLFCLISLSLYWGFLYEHYIIGIFFTIVVLVISLYISDASFSGKDYFIGKKGFSIVTFSRTRDNIVDKKVWLFKDLSYLFTGERINKLNFTYESTNYFFTFYKKLNHDNATYDVVYSITGLYSDKSPKDPMRPKDAEPEYCFMKRIEKEWTLYFFDEHKGDSSISFPIIKDDKVYSDAIIITSDAIDVYGVKYNRNNTKKIYLSNGQLIIEHQNHTKKFLGFIETGDKSTIPLADLGNRQAFIMLFDNFYKL